MNALAQALTQYWRSFVGYVALIVLIIAAASTSKAWMPRVNSFISFLRGTADQEQDDHADHAAGDVGGDDEWPTVVLSQTAMENIDFDPMRIELSPFPRTLSVPAMVAERPGLSQIHITTPLTGIVTSTYAMQGTAVAPGAPMFEIRLTHEELVKSQRDFLATSENIALVEAEIDRLNRIPQGVLPEQEILQHEYERQRLLAQMHAERQALLLHGLSEIQLDRILRDRQLLSSMTVFAPVLDATHVQCGGDHLFHVQELSARLGQQVEKGQTLMVLADHCELLVEGRAFEDDARWLRHALTQDWDVQIRYPIGEGKTEVRKGIELLYLADHIDPESHSYRFYLRLPNEKIIDRTNEVGRFITWRYNPGQHMEVEIPIEFWEDCIVVPIEALVDEGAETYVYGYRLNHFRRIPVHVEHRDSHNAVIANDGSVRIGSRIAARGAFQIHLYVKNQISGGADAHHGHTH